MLNRSQLGSDLSELLLDTFHGLLAGLFVILALFEMTASLLQLRYLHLRLAQLIAMPVDFLLLLVQAIPQHVRLVFAELDLALLEVHFLAHTVPRVLHFPR